MTLTLDAATEMRIQREIDLGHYREPSEVIACAVAMLANHEEWLLRDKDAINQRLDESYAQVQRGEVFSSGQVLAILAEDRAERSQ